MTDREPSLGFDSCIGTRDACYNCHPGKITQCLRRAMGNPVGATGKHLMECQSCHGSMATVGGNRNGWYDVPTCQSCHHDAARDTVAINPDGSFKTTADARFATNVNTPAALPQRPESLSPPVRTGLSASDRAAPSGALRRSAIP